MRCRRCNGIQAEATGPEPSPPTAGVVAGVVCARCGTMLGPVDIASRLVAKLAQLRRFGLAGHASEMAQRAGVRIVLEAARLPALAGALDAARAGVSTAGTRANRAFE